MIGLLLLDGAFVSGALPLTDRGFRYGMAVFETVALRTRRPLLLEAHLTRIAETAATAGLRPPTGWLSAARDTLLKPSIDEGVARIYLTAGDHDDTEGRAAILFEAQSLPVAFAPVAARLVPFVPATPFGKTACYWPHFLAQPIGSHPAILHRPDGFLIGGAMGNLLLLRDGRWLTPASPIRRGVVCDWVCPTPTDLTLADLATAEEIALTNSRLGILALTSIGTDRSYATGQSHVLWQRYRTEILDA